MPKTPIKKTSSFLESITALRKKFPKSNLGFREKSILTAKGAKLTKARDYPECYRVTAGNNFFVFTYGKKNYKDFTVIS